jgi:hypothetical protein
VGGVQGKIRMMRGVVLLKKNPQFIFFSSLFVPLYSTSLSLFPLSLSLKHFVAELQLTLYNTPTLSFPTPSHFESVLAAAKNKL